MTIIPSEFLREYLSKTPVLITIFNELEKEHSSKIKSLELKIEDLEKEKSELEKEQISLQNTVDDYVTLETIDFGYGKLRYVTDNLKIKSLMEDLSRTVTGV